MIIEFCETNLLVHIEGHSTKRVAWLEKKILCEGLWTKPLALDMNHNLVLDGQHRMEVAINLGLRHVPVVRYIYSSVPVRSLRANYRVDWVEVTSRALRGEIYPFKTVKHDFPAGVPSCSFELEELRQ